MPSPPRIEEVHWELTNHCNFQCGHCYLAPDSRRELRTEEALRVLKEMHSEGVLFLTLSGGEPLLRKDFPEIYRAAHGLGFLLNVFTNGSRITPEVIELFRELPPQKVEITLNGVTKETFEAVTGKAGSFAVTMEGIRLLAEAGVELGLKTNGMRTNLHEILAIKEFARGLPRTFFKFDAAIMPRRDHDLGPTRLRLSPREIGEIYEKDPEMKAQITSECRSMEAAAPSERRVFTCSAGSERFHLSAWGDLHPCHTVRPMRRSLLAHTFSDAVASLREEVAALRYPAASPCGSCRIFAQCDSCPGLAHLEGRSQVMPAAYHCDTAHHVVRAYAPEKLGAPT